MVHPNVFRVLDPNGVSVGCEDLADFQVPHNDVGLILDVESNARQGCGL